MAKPFPTDEFDAVSAPGGRHRAKRTVAQRLVSFLRYALITLVLAASGITALIVISGQNKFNDVLNFNQEVVSQPQFKADGMAVTVVDGTDRPSMASKMAHQLFDAGWNVLTATNYFRLPKWSASPTPNPVTTTATGQVIGSKTYIFVNSTAAKSAAQELAKTIGNFEVVESTAYADPITVIIGSDYK